MTTTQIPRIVYQMVDMAIAQADAIPVSTQPRILSAYAAFLDQYTERLAKRALLPITEISFEAVAYIPGLLTSSKALFPKDYPVIGIHFNNVMVGITGISFAGTKVTMHRAETTSARFLLKPEPKYLRVD